MASSFPRSFYAVRKGFTPGIYNTWAEAKLQTDGYTRPEFKKFPTEAEAQAFMNGTTTYNCVYGGGSSYVPNSYQPQSYQQPQQYGSIPNMQSGLPGMEVVAAPQPPRLTFMERQLIVYTDGSCQPSAPYAGYGNYVTMYFNGAEMPIASIGGPVVDEKTNNRAELFAIYRGIHAALFVQSKVQPSATMILSDSQYSIDCVTKWVNGWRSKGWVTTKGAPVAHRDLIDAIDTLLKANPAIVLNYIPAHSGYAGNEAADKLAKSGSFMQAEQQQMHVQL